LLELCNRFVVVEGGRIVADGSAEEVRVERLIAGHSASSINPPSQSGADLQAGAADLVGPQDTDTFL
jgi:hypothetical protein